MKFAGIKIQPNVDETLRAAEERILDSPDPTRAAFRAMHDNGEVSYCAVGALLSYPECDVRGAQIEAAVQALFFAIPRATRDNLHAKVTNRDTYMRSCHSRRLNACYIYNDSLSKLRILAWYSRAKWNAV